MLADLPTACDVGSKKNSKGYKETWIGYKLHLDVACGQIPVSCVLTSASVHDSQVAIPLMTITGARVSYLYDLMDAAYDAAAIHDHSRRSAMRRSSTATIAPSTKRRVVGISIHFVAPRTQRNLLMSLLQNSISATQFAFIRRCERPRLRPARAGTA